MSGIFDVMNNANAGEDDRTVAPSFLCGVLHLKVAGIRTNGQLRTLFEGEIGRTLTSDEIADLLDMANYVAGGSDRTEKVSRLQEICMVAGIWETGQGGISEAEARTVMGVAWS